MRALLLAVATLATLLELASSAAAAPPTAISIQGTITQFGPPGTFQGTWQSSGAFSDTGTFVETELHPTGSLAHSPVVGAFQAIIVFSGSQGTFTIGQEALITTDNFGGNWQFVSGTGAYQRLTGHGTFEFAAPNSLTFTGIASTIT
jgi:hypothetical protein